MAPRATIRAVNKPTAPIAFNKVSMSISPRASKIPENNDAKTLIID